MPLSLARKGMINDIGYYIYIWANVMIDSIHDCSGCISLVCDTLTLTHHSSSWRPFIGDTEAAIDCEAVTPALY